MIGRVLAAASVAAAFLASEAAAAPNLVPHRAVYRLTLEYTTPDSAIANAVGDLVFQIDDLCDAWSTVTEMRFAVLYESGQESRFGTYLSAWESKDGTAYRFQVKRRSTGGGRNEVIDGEATIQPEGEGEAVFLTPVERSLALPPGTLFPTLHSLAVLDAAASGTQTLYHTVFDGTEDESLFEVSTVVMRAAPQAEPATLVSPLLDGVASWRIVLAYFEVLDTSTLPSHEATLRLYENGVVDNQLFDFGDFRLRARMIELAAREKPDC
jgi:hypothetical protein